jgi:hypothetical protein
LGWTAADEEMKMMKLENENKKETAGGTAGGTAGSTDNTESTDNDMTTSSDTNNVHFQTAVSLYQKAMAMYLKSLQARTDPAAEVGLVRVQVKMNPGTWTYGLSTVNSKKIYIRSKEGGGALLVWDRNNRKAVEKISEEDGSIGSFPAAPAA